MKRCFHHHQRELLKTALRTAATGTLVPSLAVIVIKPPKKNIEKLLLCSSRSSHSIRTQIEREICEDCHFAQAGHV
jgi:hypothetical protein